MQFISDFNEYRPWSGAVDAYNRIIDERGEDALENALEQIFEGGETPTATAINDLLWFEPEAVYSLLGMKPDETTDRTLSDIGEAWSDDNGDAFRVLGVEITAGGCVRISYRDAEDDEAETETEDLDAEEVARLFGDDCGEIDESAETVETWKEDR